MYLTPLGRPAEIDLQLARPAILATDNGRGGGVFISSLSFIFFFLSCLSLSFISSTISSLFSLSLGDDTNDPQGLMCH